MNPILIIIAIYIIAGCIVSIKTTDEHSSFLWNICIVIIWPIWVLAVFIVVKFLKDDIDEEDKK